MYPVGGQLPAHASTTTSIVAESLAMPPPSVTSSEIVRTPASAKDTRRVQPPSPNENTSAGLLLDHASAAHGSVPVASFTSCPIPSSSTLDPCGTVVPSNGITIVAVGA